MTHKLKLWLCTLLVAGFWACGDDDGANLNQEITSEDLDNVSSIDEATVTFADAVTLSNQILTDEEVINGRIQQCFEVSETQNENQLLVTFQQECEGLDGKFRSGSFLIEWSGSLENEDFAYSLTFDGYKVDGYGLSGSIITSDLTFKENGFGFNVLVNDGLVNCPDGKQIIYEQDLDYDFTIQEETLQITVTGSINGTSKDGVSYSGDIREPLRIVAGCDYVVSGSFDATFDGRQAITVNYGEGSCDNVATASRGDHSQDFEL